MFTVTTSATLCVWSFSAKTVMSFLWCLKKKVLLCTKYKLCYSLYLALRDLRNPAPLVHKTHFPRRGVTVTVHYMQIQLHDWIAYVTLHLCYINMWILWILVGFFICLSFFKNLTFTILFVNNFDAVFLNITPWLQYKSGLSACHCIKKMSLQSCEQITRDKC